MIEIQQFFVMVILFVYCQSKGPLKAAAAVKHKLPDFVRIFAPVKSQ